MNSSSAEQLKHAKIGRKNTKPRNMMIAKLIRLDSSGLSNNGQNSSSGFPRITTHCSEDYNSGTDEYKNISRNGSVTHIKAKNNFEEFIGNLRRNATSFKSNHNHNSINNSNHSNYRKSAHQLNTNSIYENTEQSIVYGLKKIDETVPPRITRLMHAVEDRESKQSKDMLLTFTKKKQEKVYMMPRKFDLEDFTLQRTPNNIQQIKGLMCHYIDTHNKFGKRDVIVLPKYEKTAPFFTESMNFADKYLDDQKIVSKNFGYDEEGLKKNNLGLERILLERLIKKEQNIPNIKPLSQMSITKRFQQ